MGFRKFLVVYIVSIAMPTIIIFLCSLGMAFDILKLFLTAVVSIPIMIVGFIIGSVLSLKVTKATPQELQREDDVLLETVAFSQSVLFLLVNLTIEVEELKSTLSAVILFPAIMFYALRAWAKIKDSSKYRYYSMIAFAFVTSATVASMLGLSLEISSNFILHMKTIYTNIALSSAIIAGMIFRKRYGVKGNLFVVRENHEERKLA